MDREGILSGPPAQLAQMRQWRPHNCILKCLPSKGQHRLQESLLPSLANAVESLQVGQSCSVILKQLEQARRLLEGLADIDAKVLSPEDALDAVETFLTEDLPRKLLEKLQLLDLDARMATVNFCCVLLQMELPHGLDKQVVDYISHSGRIIDLLLGGCRNTAVAAHAGTILRSCLKHEAVANKFLEGSHVWNLMDLAQRPCFEVSTEAFSSLRQILLVHRETSAQWLSANRGEFSRRYNNLLQSGDYVVQRQALKLLSELLLERSALNLMLYYVADEQSLMIHMNFLRDPSKLLRFESFHVFKLFVANPNKPIRVQNILRKNHLGLIQVVGSLQTTTSSDEQFCRDKTCVIEKLLALPSSLEYTKGKMTLGDCSNISDTSTASPGYLSSNESANSDTDRTARPYSLYQSL